MRLADANEEEAEKPSFRADAAGRNGQQRELVELASEVNALILSGRASLSQELLDRLEAGRLEAEALDESPPSNLGVCQYSSHRTLSVDTATP